MADLRFVFHDHSIETMEEFEKKAKRCLTICGGKAEEYAKREIRGDFGAPERIDTGLLWNSITYALAGEPAHIGSYRGNNPPRNNPDGDIPSGTYSGQAPSNRKDAVYIGTNVEYAPYVHEGFTTPSGAHVTANRFLKNAVERHSDEFKKIIREEMTDNS